MRYYSPIIALIFLTCSAAIAQNWTQKANYGGGNTYQAVGFSIGQKGYVGLGYNGTFKKDFWEYDPGTNSWTQKANFGGTGRQSATGFSVGTKGYVATGRDAAVIFNDLWEYDPTSNNWTQKSSLPASVRMGAVSFSIGNFGYLGTGTVSGPTGMNDFWQYDPATDAWTQKANVGGPVRYYGVGFSINTKGYIGTGWDPTGSSGPGYTKDFWEYDPSANTWTAKAAFPGAPRMEAVGVSVSIKGKGYIGTGYSFTAYLDDFWEYDQATNAWTQKQNFGGTARDFAVGFSIDSCAYVGTGWDPFKKKDFWEYGYKCAICVPPNGSVSGNITLCSGTEDSLYAFASAGKPPYSYTWVPSTGLGCPTCATTAASPTVTTTYTVIITDVGNCPDTNFVTVTVLPSPTVIAGPDVTVNHVQNSTLTASASNGYQWNTGATSPSIVVAPSVTTDYIVVTTDANGCTSDDTVTVVVHQTPGSIYLPNAFSPNMDGENDELQLYFDAWMIQEASIVIYNRWGEVVFESSDKNFRWDGSYRGKILGTSLLVYQLRILMVEGPELLQQGNISLMK